MFIEQEKRTPYLFKGQEARYFGEESSYQRGSSIHYLFRLDEGTRVFACDSLLVNSWLRLEKRSINEGDRVNTIALLFFGGRIH
jgi:hypothetical protein